MGSASRCHHGDRSVRAVPPISGGSGEASQEVQPRRYFDFGRVETTNGLWDGITRLRYDVYCLECRYLDASQHPSGRETDEFDPHSLHFAATNERKEMVATPSASSSTPPSASPSSIHAGTLSEEFRRLPRDKTAEISRLILAKSYRRRANDGLYGEELGDPEKEAAARAEATYKRSQYPLILFGLFKEMYIESLNRGHEYWLAAMEPGLQKMLAKFGLGLKQMGDPMSYYGEVIPYYASIEELTRFVMESRPDVFQFFGQPSS